MDKQALIAKLNHLLADELLGVEMYLHYSFIVSGPARIQLKQYFASQAQDGLHHSTLLGDKIVSLGGNPIVKALPDEYPTDATHERNLLAASLKFEREGITEYTDLLAEVINNDVAMEMFLKNIIADEIMHVEELEKMLRGYADR